MLPFIPLAISIGSTGLLAYRHYKKHHAEYAKNSLRSYLVSYFWNNKNQTLKIPENYDPNTFRINGEPLFIFGIKQNLSPVYSMLLSMHADTTVRDKDGNSPLHLAVKDNNIQLIKNLISAKANVNAMNNDCKTPLFFAHTKTTLYLLLNAGAYADAQDSEGKTALFYITNRELALLLINRGASSTICDENGKLAPILEMLPKQAKTRNGFEQLLKENQIKLSNAMLNHDSTTVESMVTTIVSPDFKMPYKGQKLRALRVALYEKDIQTAIILLRAGAQTEDEEIRSLLYYAIELNDQTLIKLFSYSGCHIDGVCLAYAIEHNYDEAAIALVALCKKDFTFYDPRVPGLRNVLDIAITKNKPKIVEDILKNGGSSDKYYQDLLEYTYLHKFDGVYKVLCDYYGHKLSDVHIRELLLKESSRLKNSDRQHRFDD